MSGFSDMLGYLRKRERMSQGELAKKIGVSRSTVGMYETGQREPNFETLEAIADTFNVNMDTLLGNASSTPKNEREIGFDDFTYAMHDETKDLPEEKKQMLLEMARFMKADLDKSKDGE